MIYIAHRGNISGPNPDKENHPDYIRDALNQGFNVEIDLWIEDKKIYLGHDKPEYEIKDKYFLLNKKFWIHAKNINAAYFLSNFFDVNWFFHQEDDCVLTSKGYIWTYPGKQLTKKSIAVMPEKCQNYDISEAVGVCTDFPEKYKNEKY
jgi:hypothetical protein